MEFSHARLDCLSPSEHAVKRACSLLVRNVFSKHILVLPRCGAMQPQGKTHRKGKRIRELRTGPGPESKTSQRQKARNSASRQRISASRHMPIAPRGRIGSNLKARWAQILRAGSAHPGDARGTCHISVIQPIVANSEIPNCIGLLRLRHSDWHSSQQLCNFVKTRKLNLLT